MKRGLLDKYLIKKKHEKQKRKHLWNITVGNGTTGKYFNVKTQYPVIAFPPIRLTLQTKNKRYRGVLLYRSTIHSNALHGKQAKNNAQLALEYHFKGRKRR